MKKLNLIFLLTALLSMVGTRAIAHDIEVKNADGVTIYYNWANNQTELSVSYRGTDYYDDSDRYTGNVVIPESVTYNGATYPVTSIGERAFYYCSNLTRLTIGNSVTSIGEYAFSRCSGLTSVTIPNSVTSIGIFAFYQCSGLTSITIPNSVMSIGRYAFRDCSGLKEVNFNATNCTYMGGGILVFLNCTAITTLNIGDDVQIIPSEFKSCSGLTSISVASGNSKYDSRDNCNAIIETASNTLVVGCKNTIIPNSVTSIGSEAFRDCSGLTSVTIPNSVTSIGSSAFYQCSGLTDVTIGISVKRINYRVFKGCSALTSVVIPKSVTFFGGEVFDQCSKLKTLYYTSSKCPQGWVATTKTYVPDKTAYTSPSTKLTNAVEIIEMITFNENEFNYSGEIPSVSWTNNVEGYTASLDMSRLKKDAGNYTLNIPAVFSNEGNSFEADILYRYAMNPAVLTAKAMNANRPYGEANPTFSVTYSGFVGGEDESAIFSSPSVETIATRTSDVGDYPITVTGGKAANYSFVYEPGVLTITKAPLLGEVNHAKRAYGSENPAFTIKYHNLRNGETEPVWTVPPTFSTTATAISDVGTYEVSANGVAKNYDIFINNGTLSVEPAPLTIKANDADRLYYSENPTFNFTCNGFVNGENERVLSNTPTLSTSAKITSKVGAYEIIPSNASSKNYSISYEKGTLMIQPRALTASVEDYERVYNEENPTFEVTLAGFVGNENESVVTIKPSATTTATKTSDVGTYPIVVSGGSADNYTFNYTSGTLTINKADQTILWEQDLSHFKVGDQVVLEATSTSGLPVSYAMDSNNVAEIYLVAESTYLDCKAVGQAQVMAVQSGNHNYHSTTRLRRTVTVNDSSTAINELQNEALEEAKIFDMSGTRINNLQKGVNIVRMSDGSVKKVVVK